MYLNIGQGNALGLGNVGGFASDYYWSSTEVSSNLAKLGNFNSGSMGSSYKFYGRLVRPVRAF
jgi:hypothetical protein